MKARIEQKFPFNSFEYPKLLNWIKLNNGNYLYPPRIIVSRYFDNKIYQSYSDTLDGIVPRKKIRIRSYGTRNFLLSKDRYYLEKKINTFQNRYKNIVPITSKYSLERNLDFGIYDKKYGLCKPVCDISYVREYFFLKGVRITIDKKIFFNHTNPKKKLKKIVHFDTNNVIEIKSNVLDRFDNLLDLFPFPRSKFSKYELAFDHLDII